LPGALAALAQAAGATLPSALTSDGDDTARAMADALKNANGNAVVILGEVAENHPQASHLRAAARALAQATGARLNRIPQGANALGLSQLGVLPGEQGKSAQAMLAAPQDAYVLYGIEPQYDFADNSLAMKALAGAKVIAFSAFASDELKKLAQVILPIGSLPEIEATLTNLDGIAQSTSAGGKLPGEARPGWRVLRALAEKLALPGFDFTDLAGLRTQLSTKFAVQGNGLASVQSGDVGLERIVTTPIYRSDAVLRRSPALNSHPLTHGARAVLNPEDALKLGLSDGAMAKIGDGNGNATLPVHISPRVPKGAVWIESDYEATAPLSRTINLAIVRAQA
jgi:NADH-quinone oxidoreductase subunit G